MDSARIVSAGFAESAEEDILIEDIVEGDEVRGVASTIVGEGVLAIDASSLSSCALGV